MYQLKKPIRIVQREDDAFLVSVPAIGKRIEANQNVVDFLEYIIEKEKFEDINALANEYTKKYNITNVEDYIEMLSGMVDMKLLVNNE